MVVPGTPAADSEFDLDVSVVEAGDAVNALLCSTDNGCDTQKQGDC
ncbi:MAG: FxLD family lanthipeptide [Pseudonocardiaceae bacterium]